MHGLPRTAPAARWLSTRTMTPSWPTSAAGITAWKWVRRGRPTRSSGVIAFLRGPEEPRPGADHIQINFPKMREAGIDAGFFAIDVTLALKNHLGYALDGSRLSTERPGSMPSARGDRASHERPARSQGSRKGRGRPRDRARRLHRAQPPRPPHALRAGGAVDRVHPQCEQLRSRRVPRAPRRRWPHPLRRETWSGR